MLLNCVAPHIMQYQHCSLYFRKFKKKLNRVLLPVGHAQSEHLTQEKTTSAVSFRCVGAAALLCAPPKQLNSSLYR